MSRPGYVELYIDWRGDPQESRRRDTGENARRRARFNVKVANMREFEFKGEEDEDE